jgi:hypothetical protein
MGNFSSRGEAFSHSLRSPVVTVNSAGGEYESRALREKQKQQLWDPSEEKDAMAVRESRWFVKQLPAIETTCRHSIIFHSMSVEVEYLHVQVKYILSNKSGWFA